MYGTDIARDGWGPCCPTCRWRGQPYKPCRGCQESGEPTGYTDDRRSSVGWNGPSVALEPILQRDRHEGKYGLAMARLG